MMKMFYMSLTCCVWCYCIVGESNVNKRKREGENSEKAIKLKDQIEISLDAVYSRKLSNGFQTVLKNEHHPLHQDITNYVKLHT